MRSGRICSGDKKRCRETMHQGPAVFKTNFQAGPFLDNKDRRTCFLDNKRSALPLSQSVATERT